MWRNIDEMPMSKFVDVLCDKEYASLYTSKPKKRDSSIEESYFSELYSEYSIRMIGDDRSVFEDMKRIALYSAKIEILQSLEMLLLYTTLDDEMKRIARRNGVRITGNIKEDFESIEAAKEMAMRKYEKAKSESENKENGSMKVDRDYFMKIFASMSAHFKYAVPFSSTSVGEFCALYAQMSYEVKMMNKQLSKHGRHNR